MSWKAKLGWAAFFLLVLWVAIARFQVIRTQQRPWANQLLETHSPKAPPAAAGESAQHPGE